ncbi:hypothetical protein QBC35DRAFT_456274 [Podospora australis]|uniref:Uncharacterized protein n=1 Tax=Podospora australis TaxID=1536484 RepID=A0AAN7ACD9_9PEZI|nr:hypothetical protein QBC35DRAFT_456274 [Podospora australis]
MKHTTALVAAIGLATAATGNAASIPASKRASSDVISARSLLNTPGVPFQKRDPSPRGAGSSGSRSRPSTPAPASRPPSTAPKKEEKKPEPAKVETPSGSSSKPEAPPKVETPPAPKPEAPPKVETPPPAPKPETPPGNATPPQGSQSQQNNPDLNAPVPQTNPGQTTPQAQQNGGGIVTNKDPGFVQRTGENFAVGVAAGLAANAIGTHSPIINPPDAPAAEAASAAEAAPATEAAPVEAAPAGAEAQVPVQKRSDYMYLVDDEDEDVDAGVEKRSPLRFINDGSQGRSGLLQAQTQNVAQRPTAVVIRPTPTNVINVGGPTEVPRVNKRIIGKILSKVIKPKPKSNPPATKPKTDNQDTNVNNGNNNKNNGGGAAGGVLDTATNLGGTILLGGVANEVLNGGGAQPQPDPAAVPVDAPVDAPVDEGFVQAQTQNAGNPPLPTEAPAVVARRSTPEMLEFEDEDGPVYLIPVDDAERAELEAAGGGALGKRDPRGFGAIFRVFKPLAGHVFGETVNSVAERDVHEEQYIVVERADDKEEVAKKLGEKLGKAVKEEVEERKKSAAAPEMMAGKGVFLAAGMAVAVAFAAYL